MNNLYPFNLIRAIYKEGESDDTHTATTNLNGLTKALDTITDRERFVIEAIYRDGMTQAECGEQIDVSASAVGTILRKAIRKLREPERAAYYENTKPQKTKQKPKTEKPVAKKNHIPDTYPFNLIRAIYADKKDDNTHVNTAYLAGLDEQLETLTETEQMAIKLRFQDELTYQQCADTLNVSLEKARAHVAKAMRKLRSPMRNRRIKAVPIVEFNRVQEENELLTTENKRLRQSLREFDESGISPLHIARLASIIQPEKLQTPLYELKLSARTRHTTQRLRLHIIKDVLEIPQDQLMNEQGFGEKSRDELYNAIRSHILLPVEMQD